MYNNLSNVSPFLFGLKPSELKKSPLLQFQSTLYDKKDLLKLVLSINSALGKEKLDESKLKQTFDVWYEKLKNNLDPLLKEINSKSVSNEDTIKDSSNEAVEEILEITREQFKILRNPELILPPNYISHIIKEINQSNPLDLRVVRDLDFGMRNLKIVISSLPNEITFENKELEMAINRLERAIIFIKENHRRNRTRDLFNE